MSDTTTAPGSAPEAAAPTPAPVPAKPSGPNLFGLLALILAVLGFVAGVLPFASGLAWILFVPAIVLAIIGLTRRGRPKGLALAGLLVAIVGWIVAIVVTVATVFLGVGAAIDELPDTPVTEGELAAFGEAVTNGDGVTFTLEGVECGLASTGADFFDETPTGEWCRIDYTVRNDGDAGVSLLGSDINGYVGETAYAADDATGLFGEDYFTTDVNPGLQATCVVFVDVPAGTVLDRVGFDPVLSFADPVFSATS